MSVLLTIRNDRHAAFPVQETSFASEHVPRESEYIHLHGQARLARVKLVVSQVGVRGEGTRSAHEQLTAVVVFVVGTDPQRTIEF
jgi:hypothetical protein